MAVHGVNLCVLPDHHEAICKMNLGGHEKNESKQNNSYLGSTNDGIINAGSV